MQNRIGHLLKRPIGRPPHEVRRYFAKALVWHGADAGEALEKMAGVPADDIHLTDRPE